MSADRIRDSLTVDARRRLHIAPQRRRSLKNLAAVRLRRFDWLVRILSRCNREALFEKTEACYGWFLQR